MNRLTTRLALAAGTALSLGAAAADAVPADGVPAPDPGAAPVVKEAPVVEAGAEGEGQATAAAPVGVAAVELAPVVVRGNWLAEASHADVLEHPGARGVVRRETIEASGASSLREVLRRIPGVLAPEGSGSGTANTALNIGVRGLEARLSPRSTILLDGVPLSVAPYGQPQLSLAPISLGNLEAIDVVKSGHAVRYGPQNVGGVINFISRPVPDRFSASVGLQGSAWTDAANGGLSRSTANAFIGAPVTDSLGLALLYAGSRGEDHRAHSDEQIDDVMLKYRLQLAPGHVLSGRLHHFQGEAELAGGLSQAEYRQDRFQSVRPYDGFDGDRQEVTLKYLGKLGRATELELLSYYTQSDREFTLANAGVNSGFTRLDVTPRTYDVLAFEPRLSRLFETGTVGHEATLGYRFLTEDGRERSFRYANFGAGNPYSGTRTQRADNRNSTDAQALYLDDRISAGGWTVTPGLRYEQVDIVRQDQLNGSRREVDYDELLPSLAVLYTLAPGAQLFANYNTSFGSVQFNQLNRLPAGNDLAPEKARTVELGGRVQQGAFEASAAVFLMRFDNQIQYVSALDHHVNRGETEHRGFELASSYAPGGALRGVNLFATYSYTYATLEEGANQGNELPFYSRHLGTVGGEYQRGPWRLGLDSYLQSRQYADNANTAQESADGRVGRIAGFALWNAQLRYRVGAGEQNWVALGVKNLFDQAHYTRSNDTNGGTFAGNPQTVYLQFNAGF